MFRFKCAHVVDQRIDGRFRDCVVNARAHTADRAVTGEIHHVDAGYNVVGMKREDAPDITLV